MPLKTPVSDISMAVVQAWSAPSRFYKGREDVVVAIYMAHRYITSRSNMFISADVHPWGDFSLLTAPPPTIYIISP
jgi:hypothetical protein